MECHIPILSKEMYLRSNGVVELRHEGRYLTKGTCKTRHDDVTTPDTNCQIEYNEVTYVMLQGSCNIV